MVCHLLKAGLAGALTALLLPHGLLPFAEQGVQVFVHTCAKLNSAAQVVQAGTGRLQFGGQGFKPGVLGMQLQGGPAQGNKACGAGNTGQAGHASPRSRQKACTSNTGQALSA